MRLKDKVAVITGAGSGIGRAMATLFTAEGARVVAADVVPTGVEQVVAEIRAAGGTATALTVNVAVESEVDRMIDTAVSTYGRLDILVNNAGIVDRLLPVAEMPSDLWHKLLAVNLDGPFFACRRAVPIMLAQGGGAIINTASVAGLFGGRGGVAYTASKHAVLGMTKSIAQYYAKGGIRCNAICPGSINTPIGVGGEPHAESLPKLLSLMTLAARSGEPEEIARAALFLASDDASYVNGLALVADGGWSVV